jgi:DNA-binding CsgD family transcriptional regulator
LALLTPENAHPYDIGMGFHINRRQRRDETDAASPLTQRQAEVVSLLAAGKSTREVARVLGVAPRTVQVHVGMIMKKLGVANRLQVVALALRDLRTGSKMLPATVNGRAGTRR